MTERKPESAKKKPALDKPLKFVVNFENERPWVEFFWNRARRFAEERGLLKRFDESIQRVCAGKEPHDDYLFCLLDEARREPGADDPDRPTYDAIVASERKNNQAWVKYVDDRQRRLATERGLVDRFNESKQRIHEGKEPHRDMLFLRIEASLEPGTNDPDRPAYDAIVTAEKRTQADAASDLSPEFVVENPWILVCAYLDLDPHRHRRVTPKRRTDREAILQAVARRLGNKGRGVTEAKYEQERMRPEWQAWIEVSRELRTRGPCSLKEDQKYYLERVVPAFNEMSKALNLGALMCNRCGELIAIRDQKAKKTSRCKTCQGNKGKAEQRARDRYMPKPSIIKRKLVAIEAKLAKHLDESKGTDKRWASGKHSVHCSQCRKLMDRRRKLEAKLDKVSGRQAVPDNTAPLELEPEVFSPEDEAVTSEAKKASKALFKHIHQCDLCHPPSQLCPEGESLMRKWKESSYDLSYEST